MLNTTLVFDPAGKRVARYDKIHLFAFSKGTGVLRRGAHHRAGRADHRFEVAPEGGPRIKVGPSVCYDLRFPELYRAMGQPDLILVPAAFTATTGRAHWETLLQGARRSRISATCSPRRRADATRTAAPRTATRC